MWFSRVKAKYHQVIGEPPMNVPDWEPNEKKEYNLKEYERDIADKRKKLIETKAEDVHLYRLPDRIVLLDGNEKRLDYIVKFIVKNRFFGRKALTQVEVWTNPNSKYTPGLPQHVFFDILLKETECLVTDQYQTAKGKRFWQRAVVEAFGKGYKIYFLDQNSGLKKLIPTLKDWDREFASWYGDENKFRAKKIAICKDAFWKDTLNI